MTPAMNTTVTTLSMPKPKITEIEFFNLPSGVRKEDLLKNHSLKSYKPCKEDKKELFDSVMAGLAMVGCVLLFGLLIIGFTY